MTHGPLISDGVVSNIQNETAGYFSCGGAEWHVPRSCKKSNGTTSIRRVWCNSSVSSSESELRGVKTFNLRLAVPSLALRIMRSMRSRLLTVTPFDSALNPWPSSTDSTLGLCGSQSCHGHEGLITGLGTGKCTRSCIATPRSGSTTISVTCPITVMFSELGLTCLHCNKDLS